MSKEKQIEEMAKILTEAAHMACEGIPFAPQNDDDLCIRPTMECHHCKEARALIYAGYRKQSEGTWIWTENGESDHEKYWVCSVCKEHDFVRTKYCPNCGAHMRKEDEGK